MKKIITILLIAALFLTACTTGQEVEKPAEVPALAEEQEIDLGPTWQEQFDLGRRYLFEGKYEEAVIAFTTAIEIDPKRQEAYLGRGDAWLHYDDAGDNLPSALSDFETVTQMDETIMAAYMGISAVHILLNNLERAVEALRAGLEILRSRDLTAQSSNAAWKEQYDLGIQALLDEDYETAIEALTKAIEIDPARPEAYVARAFAYMTLGEEKELAALWDFQKALELDDACIAAYLGLAELYLDMDETDAALEILVEGIETAANLRAANASGALPQTKEPSYVTLYAYEDYDGCKMIYTGDWQNGMPNGNGTADIIENGTGEHGIHYEGGWKDGKMHGQGVQVWADGRRYEGMQEEDKFVSNQGTFFYADGSNYEGEWKDNNMEGHGVWTYADESRYEGEFKGNNIEGHGVLTYADGSSYEGEWKDNTFNGYGVMDYADGSRYEGQWENGVFNGQGVMVYSDGTKEEGMFENGTFIG